jgi:hypothetical protein
VFTTKKSGSTVFERFRTPFTIRFPSQEKQEQGLDNLNSDTDSTSSGRRSPELDERFSEASNDELHEQGLVVSHLSRPLSTRRASSIKLRSSLRLNDGINPTEETLKNAGIELTPEILEKLAGNPTDKEEPLAERRQTVLELRDEILEEVEQTHQIDEIAVEAGNVFNLMSDYLYQQKMMIPAARNADWQLDVSENPQCPNDPSKALFTIHLDEDIQEALVNNALDGRRLTRDEKKILIKQNASILAQNICEFFSGNIDYDTNGNPQLNFPQNVRDNSFSKPYIELAERLLDEKQLGSSLKEVRKEIKAIDRKNRNAYELKEFLNSDEVLALIQAVNRDLENPEEANNQALIDYLTKEFKEQHDHVWFYEQIKQVNNHLHDQQGVICAEINILNEISLIEAQKIAKDHRENQVIFLLRALREEPKEASRLNRIYKLFAKEKSTTPLSMEEIEQLRQQDYDEKHKQLSEKNTHNRSLRKLSDIIIQSFKELTAKGVLRDNDNLRKNILKSYHQIFPQGESLDFNALTNLINWPGSQEHRQYLMSLFDRLQTSSDLLELEHSLKELCFFANHPTILNSLQKFGLSLLNDELGGFLGELNVSEKSFDEIVDLSNRVWELTDYEPSGRNNLTSLKLKFDLVCQDSVLLEESKIFLAGLKHKLLETIGDTKKSAHEVQRLHQHLSTVFGRETSNLAHLLFHRQNSVEALEEVFMTLIRDIALELHPAIEKGNLKVLEDNAQKRFDECLETSLLDEDESLQTLKVSLEVALQNFYVIPYSSISPLYNSEKVSLSYQDYCPKEFEFSDQRFKKTMVFLESVAKEFIILASTRQIPNDSDLSHWTLNSEDERASYKGDCNYYSEEELSPREFYTMSFQHFRGLISGFIEEELSTDVSLEPLMRFLNSGELSLSEVVTEITFERLICSSSQYDLLKTLAVEAINVDEIAKKIIRDTDADELSQNFFDLALKKAYIDAFFEHAKSTPVIREKLSLLQELGFEVNSDAFKHYLHRKQNDNISEESLETALSVITTPMENLKNAGFDLTSHPFKQFMLNFHQSSLTHSTHLEDKLQTLSDACSLYLGNHDGFFWNKKIEDLDLQGLSLDGQDIRELVTTIKVGLLQRCIDYLESNSTESIDDYLMKSFTEEISNIPEPTSAIMELGSLRRKLNQPKHSKKEGYVKAAKDFDRVTSYLLDISDPIERNKAVFNGSDNSIELQKFLKENKNLFYNRYKRIKLLNPLYKPSPSLLEKVGLKKTKQEPSASELRVAKKNEALNKALDAIELIEPDDLTDTASLEALSDDKSLDSSDSLISSNLKSLIGKFANAVFNFSASEQNPNNQDIINMSDFRNIQAHLKMIDIEMSDDAFRCLQNSFLPEMSYEQFISTLSQAVEVLSDLHEPICQYFRKEPENKQENASRLISLVFDAANAGTNEIDLSMIVTNHLHREELVTNIENQEKGSPYLKQ